MLFYYRMFEKFIVSVLLGLMALAVFASTIELGVILYQELVKPPFLFLNLEEMLEVFGFFMMVLIGLELLETIKAYFDENRVHAEVVFLVAMVAVTRKVIILDYDKFTALQLAGVAGLIIALGIGYFAVRAALWFFSRPKESSH